MEFMPGERKKLHTKVGNIERELADSLHRIHVAGRPYGARQACNLLDWK
jgi:hypothetical protein